MIRRRHCESCETFFETAQKTRLLRTNGASGHPEKHTVRPEEARFLRRLEERLAGLTMTASNHTTKINRMNGMIRDFYTLTRKQNIKKILILLLTLLWMVHPCFAATTQSHTPSTKKATKHTSHKQSKTSINTRHTSKKTLSKKTKSQRSTKKSKKTRHRQHRATTPVSHPSTTINTPNVTKTYLPGYLLTSIEKNLVDAVRKTIATLRYTAYKLGGTRIDPSRGIYIVDCSSYVDHVLKTVYPRAYTSLTNWSGTEKPTTNDFYHYFTNLSDDDTQSHWNTIEDVEKLRPGDIIVFRSKNKIGNARGHVMIVMDKPQPTADAFLVRVADAAPAGHSTDTRMPHASGIGIGSLLLKVDAKTYRPYAYAWKIGSRWEKNVNFAMARPIKAQA